MQVQNKMFIVLAAAAMLALTASSSPVQFINTEESVEKTTTYTIYAYLDTFDEEECMLTGNKIGNGEGLLFEDFDIKNICIVLDDSRNQLYLVAVQEDTSKEIEVIQMGTFKYSYRVRYYTDDEEVQIQRTEAGEGSSQTFSPDATTTFNAEFLTAYFTAESDYEEIQDNSETNGDKHIKAYLTSWADDLEGDYEVYVKISQGSSICFNVEEGRLADIRVCVDYTDEGITDIFANNKFIYRDDTERDYSKISVTYSTTDSRLVIESAEAGSKSEELYSVAGIDVLWIVYEGVLPYTNAGELEMYIDNTSRDQYDCLTFRSSLISSSAFYPAIQGICMICDEITDNGYENYLCELQILSYDNAQTNVHSTAMISTDPSTCPQSITIKYDAEVDMLKFYFQTTDYNKLGELEEQTLLRYADELVDWLGYEDFPVKSMNEEYLLENRIQYGYSLYDSFAQMWSLSFDESKSEYGLLCNYRRCMLGFTQYEYVWVVKIYPGHYTDFMVYAYDASPDEVCFQLSNYFENLSIVDCLSQDQWRRYNRVIAQYPIWEGSVTETNYE